MTHADHLSVPILLLFFVRESHEERVNRLAIRQQPRTLNSRFIDHAMVVTHHVSRLLGDRQKTVLFIKPPTKIEGMGTMPRRETPGFQCVIRLLSNTGTFPIPAYHIPAASSKSFKDMR